MRVALGDPSMIGIVSYSYKLWSVVAYMFDQYLLFLIKVNITGLQKHPGEIVMMSWKIPGIMSSYRVCPLLDDNFVVNGFVDAAGSWV